MTRDSADGATSRWRGVVTGPRPGRMRDRRGRGPRGPMALPGPLSPRSVPAHRPPKASFDLLVGEVLAALEPHFTVEPDQVEVVVEEAPLLPPEWTDDVPLSIVAPIPDGHRIMLFRIPITQRCLTNADLEDLVWTIVLDRLAEVWHMSPDDLDPRPR
ncbi:metallopeptidase family protein [Aeromicrobium wangtongii]|uniref:Metallopeptidase family protein n=1 Tax=Aeromicrobium wangtongii TaxID=2969247 RepID=A0ABY5MD10_9ACTN|nr:metallopeptidase family protein [Aeromicrobium wangtongii]MCD9197062.1 metallopeptidase family protein [Aeromicrobium wangtongii]MCL3817986.1 metallopeptidase family protein [Aeromicrobium wangtongii]UUP14563.1 metallopeptidase family protein [Aeromicrobium wangtongii]